MFRYLTVGLLIILPWRSGLAQEEQPLLKERTSYVQVVPGDTTSWLPASNRFFSYNSHREIAYRNYQTWDRENNWWDLITEYRYEYDRQGNQLTARSLRYNEDGALVRRLEAENTFRKSLRTSRTVYFEDLEEDRWERYFFDYTYDDQDRRTYYSARYEDSNFTRWRREEIDYYDALGCNHIEVEKDLNIFLGDSSQTLDSTVTEYDEACRILRKSFYQQALFNNGYQLYYQIDVERIRDEEEQIMTELYYERSNQVPEWNLYYFILYEFDDQGRIASQVNFDLKSGRGFRNVNRYNPFDALIFESRETWDIETEDWVKEYEYEAEYLNDTLISNYIYRWDWAPERGQYLRYYILENEYDENGELVRKEESQKGLNYSNDENYFATIETIYSLRCDGSILSETVNEIRNENAPEPYQGRKVNYTYYENAPCDIQAGMENQLVVYPNPSRGDINVYNQESFGPAEIVIVNQSGQVVFQENRILNNYFSIDLNDLPSGIYVMMIKNEVNESTEKFLLID